MEFSITEEERTFREELRRFLDQELPDWWRGMFVHDERAMPFTRDFCQKLAQRDWLTMSWPTEHGGRGASIWLQAIVREEMWAADEPRGPQYMNLNYIGPMIMRFGSVEQRRRFLPPMSRGEVIWCQGFSEPDSGSDLASLRTRARHDGEHYVVTGQKIWTSYADSPADWCLLLARTDPEAPKHRGISVLLVDMATPGITVRPIDTMAGPHEFNEVFFDEVEVPVECRLGPEHEGWEIVRMGLAFERVGIARYARAGRLLEQLVAYARSVQVDGAPLAEVPAVRAKLADLRMRQEAARLVNYRAISKRDQVTSAEAAIARIHNTQVEQWAGHVALELLGPSGQLTHDDPDAPIQGDAWRNWVRNIPTTVAGGTLEMQKNLVARSLGLPRAN